VEELMARKEQTANRTVGGPMALRNVCKSIKSTNSTY